jgi:hypothetical protein
MPPPPVPIDRSALCYGLTTVSTVVYARAQWHQRLFGRDYFLANGDFARIAADHTAILTASRRLATQSRTV